MYKFLLLLTYPLPNIKLISEFVYFNFICIAAVIGSLFVLRERELVREFSLFMTPCLSLLSHIVVKCVFVCFRTRPQNTLRCFVADPCASNLFSAMIHHPSSRCSPRCSSASARSASCRRARAAPPRASHTYSHLSSLLLSSGAFEPAPHVLGRTVVILRDLLFYFMKSSFQL